MTGLPASYGKYRVEQMIGQGGFGVVYRAHDPVLKRSVAIKTLARPTTELRLRFLREAENHAALVHPNIVTVFDYGEENGDPFLVQEYLPGEDLDQRMSREPGLQSRACLEILVGIAEALRFAHRHGVFHRDVKPGNVRLTAEGGVKLMDFGIAKLRDSGQTLTQTGLAVGTVRYMSPEQLQAEQIDQRSDIFSFGVLAFELLAGRHPFGGESLSVIVQKILQEPPPLLAVSDQVAPGVAACVNACLARSPGDRPSTLDAVLTTLRQATSAAADGSAAGWDAARSAPHGTKRGWRRLRSRVAAPGQARPTRRRAAAGWAALAGGAVLGMVTLLLAVARGGGGQDPPPAAISPSASRVHRAALAARVQPQSTAMPGAQLPPSAGAPPGAPAPLPGSAPAAQAAVPGGGEAPRGRGPLPAEGGGRAAAEGGADVPSRSARALLLPLDDALVSALQAAGARAEVLGAGRVAVEIPRRGRYAVVVRAAQVTPGDAAAAEGLASATATIELQVRRVGGGRTLGVDASIAGAGVSAAQARQNALRRAAESAVASLLQQLDPTSR